MEIDKKNSFNRFYAENSGKLPLFPKNQVLHLADVVVENFFLPIFLLAGHIRMGKTCQHS